MPALKQTAPVPREQSTAETAHGMEDSHFQSPLRRHPTRLSDIGEEEDASQLKARDDMEHGITDNISESSWQNIPTPATETNENPLDITLITPVQSDVQFTNKDYCDFFNAVKHGNIDVVKAKLGAGLPVWRETEDGYTALVIAIMENQPETVRLLLERDADPEAPVQGALPLMRAVMCKNAPQMIRLLTDYGAQLHTVSRYQSMNALHWAATNGQLNSVDYLISQGMDMERGCWKGRTPLILAAENGHLSVVKILLAKGANLHGKGENGSTALTWAARNGHDEVVKHLFNEGLNIDDRDTKGLTPLSVASSEGHLEVVKFLLEKGAAVDNLSTDPKDFTPLMAAAMSGSVDVVQALIGGGADINLKTPAGNTAFELAIIDGRVSVVSHFLKLLGGPTHPQDSVALQLAVANGHDTIKALMTTAALMYPHVDPQEKQPGEYAWIDWVLERGGDLIRPFALKTMFHAAMFDRKLSLIEAILQRGYDVNAYLASGKTPLGWAVGTQNLDLVHVLLKFDADPMKLSSDGDERKYSPLHQALVDIGDEGKHDSETVSLMLNQGPLNIVNGESATSNAFAYIVRQLDVWPDCAAQVMMYRMLKCVPDVNVPKAEDGSTLMYIAVYYHQKELINTLIEKGATVDMTNEHGNTPLMVQCMKDTTMLEFLVAKGADLHKKNKYGQTAMHAAASAGGIEVVKYLLNYDVDINVADDEGMTPLLCALAFGDEDTALLLLERGADIKAKCLVKERTVFYQAAAHHHIKFIKRLLEKHPDTDVNTQDKKGWTPLASACKRGSHALIDLLLASGANHTITLLNGDTPLHIALSTGNEPRALQLLSAGASATALGQYESSPLHRAAASGSDCAIAALLDAGAPVDPLDAKGRTPLCVADDAVCARLLIARGADLNYTRPADDWTPLHHSIARGKVAVYGALVKAGAKYSRTKDDGWGIVERIARLEDERLRNDFWFTMRRRWDNLMVETKEDGKGEGVGEGVEVLVEQ